MNEKEGEKVVERIVAAPAEALEQAINSTASAIEALPGNDALKKARDYWHVLGPGLTTGASDDDPSGIATYSQTGAQYGFQLLWLSLFTFPLMAVVQEMCARIGLTTGRGLAANIRLRFPRWVLYSIAALLFVANGFNLGADLGAMASGAQLLLPGANFGLLVCLFAAVSLGFQIFTTYERYARYLKWLAMVLLAYVASALAAHLDWPDVLRHAVTPSLTFSKEQITLICAILGTTISPYLFFWQTSQEVEEQVLAGKTKLSERQDPSNQQISDMRADVWSGMLLSNVVMFFIIAACGAALFPHGITNITSAAQAAEALRPFAGDAAYILFAVGIIGTGLLAVPVLAGSAAYTIAESFGWKGGLHRTLRQAHAFYGVIIISMLVGLGMNFIGLDPIKALIWSAVANGLVAPVALTLIVLLSSSKTLMGKRVNAPFTTFVGWATTLLMVVAGIAAVYSLSS